jgi:hypothetical protein
MQRIRFMLGYVLSQEEQTSIRISKDVREELGKKAKYGETMDEALRRILGMKK